LKIYYGLRKIEFAAATCLCKVLVKGRFAVRVFILRKTADFG
jgi:hypothetical protein